MYNVIVYVLFSLFTISCVQVVKNEENIKDIGKVEKKFYGTWVSEAAYRNFKNSVFVSDCSDCYNKFARITIRLDKPVNKIMLEYDLGEIFYTDTVTYQYTKTAGHEITIYAGKDSRMPNQYFKIDTLNGTLNIKDSSINKLFCHKDGLPQFKRFTPEPVNCYYFKEWLFYKTFFKRDYILIYSGTNKKSAVAISYDGNFIRLKKIDKKIVTLQSLKFIVDSSIDKKVFTFLDFDDKNETNWVPYILCFRSNGTIEFYKTKNKIIDKMDFSLIPRIHTQGNISN